MKKIFLHIGTNKTGTSAIQSFFSYYRDILLDQGLLYPEVACQGSAHYDLTDALIGRGANPRRIAKKNYIRKALDAEIEKKEPKAVILSSEIFVRATSLDEVSEFFKNDDVYILVYLRRHDTWWPAAYSQAMKTKALPPWPPGIEGFIRFSRNRESWSGRYRELIDRWASVFGREKIIVRPYEEQQNSPDLIIDFLGTIAAEMNVDIHQFPELFSIRSARRNISLSPRALQCLEAFQRANLKPEIRDCLIGYAISLSTTENNQPILSPARRLELIEENAADYEYIAREYMGRQNGQLFYDLLPDPNEVWAPPGRLTLGAIVEETVNALSAPESNTSGQTA